MNSRGTVGKNASFLVIFLEKGKFSDAFEADLTNIFKYLVPKTVRQKSQVCPFLGLKNGQNSEFCRMVLYSRYLSLLVKLGSNIIETLRIGIVFA